MLSGRHRNIIILMSLIFMMIGARSVAAGSSDPPNFQLEVTVKYRHPSTRKQVTLKTNSTDRLKTFQVPAGVNLTFIFQAYNIGGNPGGDGVSLDIWFDWPRRTHPGDDDTADVVCVPFDPRDCLRITKTIRADLSYKGKTGKGIYNIVAWVDRFDTLTEDDEEDNYLGPVKIVVLPTVQMKKEPLMMQPPTTIKPLRRK